jgi:hypothetical protein
MLDRTHVRGNFVQSEQEFERKAAEAVACGSSLLPRPYFAGTLLPYEAATQNFLFVGAPGTGKSSMVDALMHSVLHGNIGPRGKHRAIVYDHSGTSIGTLSKMGCSFAGGTLKTLNPLDKRCARWEMCSDITTEMQARQLASILIPVNQEAKDKFWEQRAQSLLFGILVSFIKLYHTTKYQWQLSDVLKVALSQDLKVLTNHLKLVPKNKRFLRMFSAPAERSPLNDILAVFENALEPLVLTAQLWARAKSSITIDDFLNASPSFVLVLGLDESTTEATEVANRIFLSRLVDQILVRDKFQQDSLNPHRLWFFLDEGARLGRIPRLMELLSKGRKTGVSMVLSMHDIIQLEAVYEGVAHSLLAKFGNVACLRVEDVPTAKWFTELLGSREVMETQGSVSMEQGNKRNLGNGVTSRVNDNHVVGANFTLREVPLILSSELHTQHSSTGAVGVFKTVCAGVVQREISYDSLHQRGPTGSQNEQNAMPYDLSNTIEWDSF